LEHGSYALQCCSLMRLLMRQLMRQLVRSLVRAVRTSVGLVWAVRPSVGLMRADHPASVCVCVASGGLAQRGTQRATSMSMGATSMRSALLVAAAIARLVAAAIAIVALSSAHARMQLC